MTWLLWRQGRSENLLVAAMLGAVAAFMLLTGANMHSAFGSSGLSQCTSDAAKLPAICSLQVNIFVQRFDGLNQLGPWLSLIPGLIGVLLATPLVLELDQGTYRLAWTQSITPRRWLTTRLALLVLAVVVCGLIVIALGTYWRQPLDSFGGRVGPNAFDLEGIVPIAYILFAAAAVLAIGAVSRRTGLAVAGGFGAYLLVRLVLRSARDKLITPFHTLSRPPSGPQGIRHSWIISQSYTMPGSKGNAYNVLRSCITPDGSLDSTCMSHHNIFSSWTYEPPSRFWPLQSIEAGIFLILSAILVAVAVWWIRHRIS